MSRRLKVSSHWLAPAALAIIGYGVFLIGSWWAPKGLDAHPVNVPAVTVAYGGIAAMLVGLIMLSRRSWRALRRRIPHPGDRSMAARWDAAAAVANQRWDHLVWISDVKPFGRAGCKAQCTPYADIGYPSAHSSWFEGRLANHVRGGRWMHLDGQIGSGKYRDSSVLYVRRIIETFPSRAPDVAEFRRSGRLKGVKAIP